MYPQPRQEGRHRIERCLSIYLTDCLLTTLNLHFCPDASNAARKLHTLPIRLFPSSCTFLLGPFSFQSFDLPDQSSLRSRTLPFGTSWLLARQDPFSLERGQHRAHSIVCSRFRFLKSIVHVLVPELLQPLVSPWCFSTRRRHIRKRIVNLIQSVSDALLLFNEELLDR